MYWYTYKYRNKLSTLTYKSINKSLPEERKVIVNTYASAHNFA